MNNDDLVRDPNQIMEYMRHNPQFIEMDKLIWCHNNNIPARIDGEVKKITRIDWRIGPYMKDGIKFYFDTADWEGEANKIIDIDMSVFE